MESLIAAFQAAQLRQEKETRKKQLKKERRQLRAVCKVCYPNCEVESLTFWNYMSICPIGERIFCQQRSRQSDCNATYGASLRGAAGR